MTYDAVGFGHQSNHRVSSRDAVHGVRSAQPVPWLQLHELAPARHIQDSASDGYAASSTRAQFQSAAMPRSPKAHNPMI